MFVENEPKVSVVVPVYNAEKYLKECVDSIINQTLRDIEIIFVDDGSTDTSLSILRDYQKNDSRIQIYTQKNQYAGVARNNGMNHATGKYIIFLDADDFFDLKMLEKMFNAAEESQADITVCGYNEFDTELNKVVNTLLWDEGCFSLCDMGSDCMNLFTPNPWNRLFRRGFIRDEGLVFQGIENTNDTFFTRIAGVLAHRTRVINGSLVYYRVNNRDSLQGTFGKRKLCFGEALTKIKDELTERGLYSGIVKKSFYNECASMMLYYLEKGNSASEEKRVYDYCVEICEKLSLQTDDELLSQDKSTIRSILKRIDYIDYLYEERNKYRERSYKNGLELKQIKRNTISKASTTYKIGHAVLFIPDKVFKLKKHILRIKESKQ